MPDLTRSFAAVSILIAPLFVNEATAQGRGPSLAETASQVLSQLPSTPECQVFSVRLAPAIRSNEQRPRLQDFFETLLEEGRSGRTCSMVIAERSRTLDPDRFENRMPNDGGVMEQWWGWANKCALTFCDGTSKHIANTDSTSEGGVDGSRAAVVPIPAPALSGSSPAARPLQREAAVTSPGSSKERANCIVTWAASVTNKLPIDPSLLEANEFWQKVVKPHWRTGKLMKFVGEAEREADSDFWAASLARSDANDIARKAFDEMRSKIWHLYAPGALDFNAAHRYEKCRNVRTGELRPGSQDAPDFIPEEVSP